MAIFKKNGNFYIDYYFQGKRIREKVGPNRTLAKQALTKRKAEIAENRFFPERRKDSIPFEQMAERYWTLHGKNTKGVSMPYMMKKITKVFAGRPLNQITVPMALEFINLIRDKTSISTANRYHGLLRAIFNRAVDWGYYDGQNPFSKIRQGKEPPHRLRFLSKEEIPRLLGACSQRIYGVVACALLTGLRRGEILSLKWANLDLENGVIYVLESKSGKPREIPISPKLRNVLAQIPVGGPKERVFSVTEDALLTDFLKALKLAQIHEFRFHDLRHTFASYFVMRTNDLPTLQKLLGHHSPAMTQRYAHLSQGHLQVGILTFDAGLSWIEKKNSKIAPFFEVPPPHLTSSKPER